MARTGMSRSRVTRSRAAIAAVAALALGSSVLLAGCSSDDAGSAASAVATSSALPSGAMSESPSAGGALIGGDPATWAPIIIRKSTTTVDLVVGQVAIAPALKYADLPYVIEVSDPAVVSVTTPDAGQVVAVQGVAAGTSTVTVYRGKGKANGGKGKVVAEVEVTVSEQ